jgi:HTH-type transcriptional regulator / antitoxin HigA
LKIKPVRNEVEHEQALKAACALMSRSDDEGLELLLVYQALIEQWERRRFSLEAPTPAQAIKFRMEQLDLRPRDLIAYLGTKSRVSEILSGQRQLTVDQIRALNRHLGIPTDSLIGVTKHEPANRRSTASRAAIDKLKKLGVMKPRENIDVFLDRASRVAPAVAMLRKTRTDRTNAKTDLGALEAWCAGALVKAERQQLPKQIHRVKWGPKLARELAQLSVHSDGPLRAKECLRGAGIIMVVLEHLPGTYLDGAAICRGDGAPVIALTLRHDRIDNFWFTLLHEFAHVSCHLNEGTQVIIDDLDVKTSEAIELEADEFARNALLPPKIWAKYALRDLSVEDVEEAAAAAFVHPAIVAGRWRWDTGDYRRFSKLLGHGEVRKHL